MDRIRHARISQRVSDILYRRSGSLRRRVFLGGRLHCYWQETTVPTSDVATPSSVFPNKRPGVLAPPATCCSAQRTTPRSYDTAGVSPSTVERYMVPFHPDRIIIIRLLHFQRTHNPCGQWFRSNRLRRPPETVFDTVQSTIGFLRYRSLSTVSSMTVFNNRWSFVLWMSLNRFNFFCFIRSTTVQRPSNRYLATPAHFPYSPVAQP